MHITLVAGTRPNFVKIAPIIHALKKYEKRGIKYDLVHTGQHYDDAMSRQFFVDLNIPTPSINLNCGGGTQAEQTGKILIAFEDYLNQNKTDCVVVVGDVNSTLACAISAKKKGIFVAHVESGLRSYDLGMPEEINRIATDAISDVLYTTTKDAKDYLIQNSEKIENQIHFVGNVMIDSLKSSIHRLKKPSILTNEGIKEKEYFLLTIHRPSNVDEALELNDKINILAKNCAPYPILFPVHPRTKKKINHTQLPGNLICTNALGYLEFIYLLKNAKGVLTDSGGITEEATYLGIPCITLRENTERPETVTLGTNILAGNDLQKIAAYILQIKNNEWKSHTSPELWDGRTAERIVNHLASFIKDSVK